MCKKILIDCRSAIKPHTGIGMYINGLVSHLSDKVNKYFILCYDGYEANNINGLQFEYIRIKKRNKHLENQITVPFLVYKKNIDLFHVTHHDVFPVLYFKKIIISVMDIFWIDHKNNSSFIFRFLYYMISFIAFKRAKKIITISFSTKKSIKQKFNLNADKIQDILISCDDEYKRKCNNKVKYINDLMPYVLYIGSSAKRKNIQIFNHIDKTLKDLGHKINFIFITKKTGKNDSELDSFFQKDNFIIDHNDYTVNELNEFYTKSLVFIFPSNYEGFGLPALEAIKCGTIPIVSSSTSLPEIVLNDNDFIVDPIDYVAFANKILRIKNDVDYRNKLLDKLSIISKSFDWNLTSSKTELLYEI
jgi:glycosyltransferase involved in cell wall biosynthesis